MNNDRRKKIIKWFWIIILFPFAFLALSLLLVVLFARIPSFEELENPDNKLATQVIATDGELLATFHIENRTNVEYDELSPYLIQAAVATEDARFYKHSGIDLPSLFRVLFKTILMRNDSQGGGSTITQQLAKTLYPREEAASRIPGWSKVRMFVIKLREWVTAVKLERDYTKEEIVKMYLNSIFFGSGAYGIRSASETFFSKLPSELTLEESATLVGMVNKPTRYNPAINPELSLRRRNLVISRMQKAGYISKAESDSVRAIPINLKYQVMDHNAGVAPYFRDMIRRDMNAKKPRRSDYEFVEEYSADSLRWVVDDFYGWLNKNKKANGDSYDLDRDGLRIYTTINYKMQKYAEEAVAEHLGQRLQKDFFRELRWKKNRPFSSNVEPKTRERLMKQARQWSDRYRMMKKSGASAGQIEASFDKPAKMRLFAWNKKGYIDTTMTPNDSIRYYKSILRTGFVAVEPGTGHVKAYVGGPNYRFFKFDNVRQGKRQVGSTIKPFLYTLAMNGGMSPCDQVINVPQTFELFDGTTWTPRSTDKDEWIGKTVTLKWGITHSSNNISAYLMKQFAPFAMVDMMHQMGISAHIDPVVSLCTGPADISLFEMVCAYNTFPSKGVYITPMYVTRIEDSSGNVLGEFTNRKTEAISDRTAYLMTNLLQGVVNNGTAYRLRGTYRLKGQIAGKTGTTNDNSDGWFIGYTPSITAGVWVGGEDRQVHFESLALGSGSNMALPIWGIWMKKLLADGTLGISEADFFAVPADMNINLDCSGGDSEIMSKSARRQEEQYFFE